MSKNDSRIKDFAAQNQSIQSYVESTFQTEDPVLREVRNRSIQNGLPDIQIASTDARHLEILVRLSGAKKIVEIGTLGGYSGICLLRGGGPESFLHTFELEKKNAAVAQESFDQHGFTSQVKIHQGPANENLQSIESEGPFDLVFIDANKKGYPEYARWAAEHLKKGGVLIGDNTFAFGKINADTFESPLEEEITLHLREFNEYVASSGLFRGTILPTGEGLTVGIKL